MSKYAKGRTLAGLYATKAAAHESAAKLKGGFVLPPRNAWAGRQGRSPDAADG